MMDDDPTPVPGREPDGGPPVMLRGPIWRVRARPPVDPPEEPPPEVIRVVGRRRRAALRPAARRAARLPARAWRAAGPPAARAVAHGASAGGRQVARGAAAGGRGVGRGASAGGRHIARGATAGGRGVARGATALRRGAARQASAVGRAVAAGRRRLRSIPGYRLDQALIVLQGVVVAVLVAVVIREARTSGRVATMLAVSALAGIVTVRLWLAVSPRRRPAGVRGLARRVLAVSRAHAGRRPGSKSQTLDR
jgi:hypothetical protein